MVSVLRKMALFLQPLIKGVYRIEFEGGGGGGVEPWGSVTPPPPPPPNCRWGCPARSQKKIINEELGYVALQKEGVC